MTRRRGTKTTRALYVGRRWSRTEDAPALPAADVVGAAVAEPGPVPDNLRSYAVGVVAIKYLRPPFTRYRAFTKDRYRYDAYCEHGVSATSGDEAKILAISEHKAKCVR